MKTGMVYLVGAGPGDPGLITVKGKDAIAQADCIVYDRLAAPELLSLAPEGCEMVYVGKENHHHTMKQDDINELLYQKALEYERVVRLKGGDVYVFGRGGEEGMYLRERGVSFEVVPGISSALAGLAYAGIPITHRGVAMGFHVVTAHNKRDELANIDFEAMARGKDTLVFLMGLSKLPEIAAGLMAAGMHSDKPVAVISHATMTEQKTSVGNLDTIVKKVEEDGLTSPALIVVGDVVNLREKLDFRSFNLRSNQDLVADKWNLDANVVASNQGHCVLVPRIGTESSELVAGLKQLGAHVDEVQVGEILTMEGAFSKQDVEEASWIVLTSKHGVDSFFEELHRMKIDFRMLAGKKFSVVGSKTAARLEENGFYADLIPEKFLGDNLCVELGECVDKETIVFYGMAASEVEKANSGLVDLEGKCRLHRVALYENKVRNQDKKITSDYDCICFSCASSVNRLWEMLDEKTRTRMKDGDVTCISIGAKTSEALKQHDVKGVIEADVATYKGMLERYQSI